MGPRGIVSWFFFNAGGVAGTLYACHRKVKYNFLVGGSIQRRRLADEGFLRVHVRVAFFNSRVCVVLDTCHYYKIRGD